MNNTNSNNNINNNHHKIDSEVEQNINSVYGVSDLPTNGSVQKITSIKNNQESR